MQRPEARASMLEGHRGGGCDWRSEGKGLSVTVLENTSSAVPFNKCSSLSFLPV